jgi:hypothetical protein
VIHEVPNGHTFRQEADGTLYIKTNGDRWLPINQKRPITVAGNEAFAPLGHSGFWGLTMEDLLWLSSYAGLGVGVGPERYAVAIQENFLGNGLDTADETC